MGVSVAELQGLALFASCEADDLTVLVQAESIERTVDEGEHICLEGEPADRWWIVVEGIADVTTAGIYTASIGPGETIGEMALLDDEPRAATVTAATTMRVHELAGSSLLDALASSPRLSLALLRQLARWLRERNRSPVRPRHAVPSVPGREFFIDLAARREASPVHWSDELSSYVITRYDDVHRLSRSRALIGSITALEAPVRPDDAEHPPRRPGWRMMINRDGDDHTRLRRLVSKVFTPRAVSQWQAKAERIVDELLADLREHDHADVMESYALPLPARIITEMLGMPPDDTPQLREWSRTLTRGLDPGRTAAEEEASAEAGRLMTEYVEKVIVDKRDAPGDDILTALLEAEDSGDMLDDKEVVAQVLLLYIAGHETTLNLIGNGVTHLFRFPEQLQLLRTEPSLDANAVEEVLRFESPAQLTRRINIEPIEIGDMTIPAGSHVTLSLASANHDPRKWGPTADVLDIGRPGANEHVSFGGGPHYCLGASLARLEAKIALPALVRQFPTMAPAYDEPDWLPRVALRGVETLKVTLR